MGSNWWIVIIGANNGVVPTCNKPLPGIIKSKFYIIKKNIFKFYVMASLGPKEFIHKHHNC